MWAQITIKTQTAMGGQPACRPMACLMRKVFSGGNHAWAKAWGFAEGKALNGGDSSLCTCPVSSGCWRPEWCGEGIRWGVQFGCGDAEGEGHTECKGKKVSGMENQGVKAREWKAQSQVGADHKRQNRSQCLGQLHGFTDRKESWVLEITTRT